MLAHELKNVQSKYTPEVQKVISLNIIRNATTIQSGLCVSNYQDLTLSTALQPIYSIDHQRIIGYEALIRAIDGDKKAISPDVLFSRPKNDEESIYLDRLCRFIHLANFQILKDDSKWLFLNISSLTCEKGRQYGHYFSELLDHFAIPASNVVIEIIEDHTNDIDKLVEAANYYKSMGCLLAIDDFGAGHSNFDRVWALQPDIVKLDRSMITQVVGSNENNNKLSGIVKLLHQSGCLVVIEGVENEQQALIALDSGADFIQGFYFSRPQPIHHQHEHKLDLFRKLSKKYLSAKKDQLSAKKRWSTRYEVPFKHVIENIKKGKSLTEASDVFNLINRASRCYLLDDTGNQIGSALTFNMNSYDHNDKFRQLKVSENANWYRKHYVRNALKQTNHMHVTAPYQSITREGLCITLSMFFETAQGKRILCLDVSHNYKA